MQEVNIIFAKSDIECFSKHEEIARLSNNPAEIAHELRYIVTYYPSGTRNKKNSQIDKIVEAARMAYIRLCINKFRSITGNELGDDPQPWISKYLKEK